MTDIVEKIVRHFAENIKEILGDTLDAVIVYGSYARDDYSEFSDIDVMILVSLMAEQIKEIEDKISDLAKVGKAGKTLAKSSSSKSAKSKAGTTLANHKAKCHSN